MFLDSPPCKIARIYLPMPLGRLPTAPEHRPHDDAEVEDEKHKPKRRDFQTISNPAPYGRRLWRRRELQLAFAPPLRQRVPFDLPALLPRFCVDPIVYRFHSGKHSTKQTLQVPYNYLTIL